MVDRMDQNPEILTRYLDDLRSQDVTFRLSVEPIDDIQHSTTEAEA
jgi:hypothetical protein